MICPNCNSHNEKYLYKYQDYNPKDYDLRCTSLQYKKPNIIKCYKCKLIFSELHDIDFEKLYGDVVDTQYIELIPFKKLYFFNTLKKIEKYLDRSKNVLEIGSYYGVFGSIINEQVKSYQGIELSSHAIEYSKKNYNLNVYNKTIEEFLPTSGDHDVILMSHVIEHLDNPFDNLRMIRNAMNEKSVFIFSTYNMDSIIAKLLGKHYHWIMPMHKFYFTKSFLKNFMENNGFQLIETITDTHTTSLKYFFTKLQAIMPFSRFILKPLNKIKFLNNVNIKINLGDLDLYIFKKAN